MYIAGLLCSPTVLEWIALVNYIRQECPRTKEDGFQTVFQTQQVAQGHQENTKR